MTTTLQPGPALDALIAEKVMAWEYVIDGEGTGWVDKATEQFVTGYNNDDPSHPEILPPPFSTSIAAAWEVVEKLKNSQTQFSLCFTTTFGWTVFISNGDSGIHSDTAPHAICLAAMAWADKEHK